MKTTVKNLMIAALAASILLTGCKGNDGSISSSQYSSSQIPLTSEPLNPQQIDETYATYENEKFDYTFLYPSYMEIAFENKNNDGIKLIDSYGGELSIYGAPNIENRGTKYYLDDIKSKVNGIVDSYIDDFSYEISYKGNATDTSENYRYFEAGYIKGDVIIRFLYKYNAKENDIFRPKARYMSENMVELNRPK